MSLTFIAVLGGVIILVCMTAYTAYRLYQYSERTIQAPYRQMLAEVMAYERAPETTTHLSAALGHAEAYERAKSATNVADSDIIQRASTALLSRLFASPLTKRSLEDRLVILVELKNQGLVTEEQYNHVRSTIINKA